MVDFYEMHHKYRRNTCTTKNLVQVPQLAQQKFHARGNYMIEHMIIIMRKFGESRSEVFVTDLIIYTQNANYLSQTKERRLNLIIDICLVQYMYI